MTNTHIFWGNTVTAIASSPSNISKKRLVNIELLRIISMFLVLLIHYNIPINGLPNHVMAVTNPMKVLGSSMLSSLDFVCVNCFVIISGYFGIKWKWKGLLNFLFQISFWSLSIYSVAILLGVADFSMIQLARRLFLPIMQNWFFVCYLLLYILSPIVNTYVEHTNEKQILHLILTFVAFQTFFGWITKCLPEMLEGLNTMNLLGYYLIGAYLKKSTLRCFHIGAKADIAIYFGIALFLTIASFVTKYIGFTKDVFSYISPFCVVQSIYLFLFFRDIKIENERLGKIILFFSSSAFAVLMMHEWEASRLYYGGLNYIDANMSLPFIASVLFMIAYLMVACCLDKVRMWCWNIITCVVLRY